MVRRNDYVTCLWSLTNYNKDSFRFYCMKMRMAYIFLMYNKYNALDFLFLYFNFIAFAFTLKHHDCSCVGRSCIGRWVNAYFGSACIIRLWKICTIQGRVRVFITFTSYSSKLFYFINFPKNNVSANICSRSRYSGVDAV